MPSHFRHLRYSTMLTPPELQLDGWKSASSFKDDVETVIRPFPETFKFKLSKLDRGIILSNPIVVDGRSITGSPGLDQQELRRALMFWDIIAWPCSNGVYFSGGVEEEYLENIGKIVRPKYSVNGDAAQALAMSFTETYKFLEGENPGQWAFSSGERSIILKDKEFQAGRGALIELYNAIPIPQRDVPLSEVLEFRERRIDELRELRAKIDGFYQSWVNSEDKHHKMMVAISEIQSCCSQVIKVSKESKLRFLLSDWKIGVSFSGKDVLDFVSTVAMGKQFGLDGLSSLLSGSLAFLNLSKDIGPRSPRRDLTPFNYIASAHREL